MRKLCITLSVLITVGLVTLGVFVFSTSYLRFAEAITDMGRSIGIYFSEIFGIHHNIPPTVNDYSQVFGWGSYLPEDFDVFKQDAGNYFALLVNGDNFSAWGKTVGAWLGKVAKVLILLLPCIVILCYAIRWLYRRRNTQYNRDTIPLRAFKWVAAHTYQPLKRFLQGYIAFLRQYRWIWICWTVMVAFHLNLASIVAGFLAFYFYFVVTFDVATIYTQVCKLLIDINIILQHFPWWSLATVAWLLFNRYRRRIALNRLRHFEARNCGFINELPIVSMTCGSMGKKKTTVITDMGLSQAVMFRQKALSILQNNDMKFPYFPWICFESCKPAGNTAQFTTLQLSRHGWN